MSEYLYIKNTGTSNLSFTLGGTPLNGPFETSADKVSWTEDEVTTLNSIVLAPGELRYFRAHGGLTSYGEDSSQSHLIQDGWFRFAPNDEDSSIEVGGNAMSLLRYDDYLNEEFVYDTDGYICSFAQLFKDVKAVINIDNLILPKKLDHYYFSMAFYGCNNLQSIPEHLLPSRVLADYCYDMMFVDCESLTSLPEHLLPAMNLKEGCYREMFENCSSIEIVPTNFLPAHELERFCYYKMFYRCSELHIVTLHLSSWGDDFNGATGDWLTGVAATGDIYFRDDMGGTKYSGVNSYPFEWTTHTFTEPPEQQIMNPTEVMCIISNGTPMFLSLNKI